MSREWKPGDVAMVTVMGKRVRAMRGALGNWWAVADGAGRLHGDGVVSDIRRLVVIDPEDRDQVEALIEAVPPMGRPIRSEMQDALRSLLTPPKPDEPTGLGAVVEDESGKRWTRCAADTVNGTAVWYRPGGGGWTPYSTITAVKVLSEGVTP